jgi:hypothetical protein
VIPPYYDRREGKRREGKGKEERIDLGDEEEAQEEHDDATVCECYSNPYFN